MSGLLQNRSDYKDGSRKAGMNTVEEELDAADTVRTFNGNDKLNRENHGRWKRLNLAQEGEDFREKEVKRTIATQRKDSWSQEVWYESSKRAKVSQ